MKRMDVDSISERCSRGDCASYERCAFSQHRAALDDTQSNFQPRLSLEWRHERSTNLAAVIIICLSYNKASFSARRT